MNGPLTVYEAEPLQRPILVVAYAGWSDGGDAATTAVRSLLEQFQMTRYACIDTEEYLDFTVVRPHVRICDGGQREIVWPNHEFFAARLGGAGPDLLLGLGIEPHLRWKSYARSFVELVRAVDARLVVLLGAYLDEVIYSQPIQVGGYTSDAELGERLELVRPSYEGPTGIVGVLGEALRSEKIESASLWARIPHYVPTTPNTRAALALLHAVQRVSGLRFDLGSLESEAASFDEEVSQLIATDPQLAAYVRELKRRVFTQ